jgi:SAM-dependent methyltransferase
MQLIDLVNRSSPPLPWEEGDNIPWNELGFSRRMLKEHLSQEHDAASRRFTTIDKHVDWIHTILLDQHPTSILDLACGPGFYSERLSRMGHTCHGIDYSPASVTYAISTTNRARSACTYVCQDIRQAEFPTGIGFVMLIYGEFNVFRPAEAAIILDKAWGALEPDGILLLEPHPYRVVQELGEKPASWYSSPGGLFSERPHIVLQENFWNAEAHVSTIRYYVIDAHTGQVNRYGQSMQAYQDGDYRALLTTHDFEGVELLPGLLGENSPQGLMAIVARKKTKITISY